MTYQISEDIINLARLNPTTNLIIHNDGVITGKDLLQGAAKYLLDEYPDKKSFLILTSNFSEQVYAFLGCLVSKRTFITISSDTNIFEKISLIKKTTPEIIVYDNSYKMSLFTSLLGKSTIYIPINKLKQINKNHLFKKVSGEDFCQMITLTSGSTGSPTQVKRLNSFVNHQMVSLKNLMKKIIKDDSQLILTNQANIIFIIVSCGHQCLYYNNKTQKFPKEVTAAIGSVSMHEIILKNQISCDNIILGGSPVYTSIVEKLNLSYPHTKIYSLYGSTECEPISYMLLNNIEQNYGLCVGKPLYPILIDSQTHEILVSGPNINPSAVLKTINNIKYFSTGDAGYLDSDGLLWLLGRVYWKQHSEEWSIPLEDKLLNKFPLKQAFFLENCIYVSPLKTNRIFLSELKEKIRLDTGYPVILKKDLPVDKRHQSKPNFRKILRKDISSNSLKAWIYFFVNRVPVLAYLLLSYGTARSYKHLLNLSTFKVTAALVLISITLRFMDEIKDYQKDLIGNPGRPLPRGIISIKYVNIACIISTSIFIILGLSMSKNIFSKCLCLTTAGYCWLMYKHFGFKKYFKRFILEEIFLDQLLHPIMILFFFSLSDEKINLKHYFSFSLLSMGAFFTFEVSRKMDPFAPPQLETYRVLYGNRITFILIAVSCSLSIIGLYGLKSNYTLVSIKISIWILSLCMLSFKLPRTSLDKIIKFTGIASILFYAYIV